MSIRFHLIALVLFCALGGVALGTFLIDRQYEANRNSAELAQARKQRYEVQRLEDQVKSLLISTDLLFGSGETYLLATCRANVESALKLSRALTAGLSGTSSDSAPSYVSIPKHLVEMAEQIDALERAASAPGFSVQSIQLDRVDELALELIDALQLLQVGVDEALRAGELKVQKHKSEFDLLAWSAVAGYLFSLLASLWYASSAVSKPLAKLSSAANQALIGQARFSVQPEGPTEVRSLASNIREFIESLERNYVKSNALIEAIPDTLFVVHRDRGILQVKPGANVNSRFLGDHPDWISIQRLLGGEQAVVARRMVMKCLETQSQQAANLKVEVASKKRHIEARATSLNSDEVVVVLRDLTDKHRAEARIRHMAYHDSLTGLLNRRAFKDELSKHFEAQLQEPLALFYIDVDRFKTINDTYGHEAGDSVLKHVTDCISDCLRPGDKVGRFERKIEGKSARIGGDEFVLLLPGITDEASANSVAARLQSAVMTPFESGNARISVSASIGISLYPEHGETVESLMHHADLAMFQAKRAGGQGACVFSPNLGDKSRRKLSVEAKLRAAIENEDLFVLYQPKLDLASRLIVGAEALVRWRDGDAVIPPNEFIPISEESGLIVPLGEYVAASAARQMAAWRSQGFRLGSMAINVSALQLKQEGFVEFMSEIAAREAVPPSALNLEITESMLMGQYDTSVEVLTRLRERGFSIAMDDFGTGYSSLSYLKDLPLDVLKIDRAFVSGITESQTERAIIAAILQLGATLGLRLVAEGVETEEHANFLTANGCDEAQGYLFSPPVSSEDFEKLLCEQRSNLGESGDAEDWRRGRDSNPG